MSANVRCTFTVCGWTGYRICRFVGNGDVLNDWPCLRCGGRVELIPQEPR